MNKTLIRLLFFTWPMYLVRYLCWFERTFSWLGLNEDEQER